MVRVMLDTAPQAERECAIFLSLSAASVSRLKANRDSLFLPPNAPQSRVEELCQFHSSTGGEKRQGRNDSRLNESHVHGNTVPLLDPALPEQSVVLEHRLASDIHQQPGRNPSARFFFVPQYHSWSPLQVSWDLFLSLMEAEDISPQFLEYLIYFGSRRQEVEIVPPRTRFLINARSDTPDNKTLEWMYVLRFVELNGRGNQLEPTTQWSLRQSAIYCQYDCANMSESWTFVALSREARRKIQLHYDALSLQRRPEHECLAVHAVILETGISNWRHYVIDIAAEIDEKQAQVAGASPDGVGPIDFEEWPRRQELMGLEEKVLNAIMSVKATIDTLSTLLLSVDALASSRSPTSCATTEQLQGLLRELGLILMELESMQSKLASVAQVLSGSLELNSGYVLQSLAQASAKENEEMHHLSLEMHELTKKGTQDAVAVRVLTVLTLVYLPATVVSNFFSTSFIGTASTPSSSTHITISGDWWILAATAIPLTFLTLYIWFVWTQIEARRTYPWWWLWKRSENRELARHSPKSSQTAGECFPDV